MTVVGFILLIVGFLALILGFIGLSIWPLTYLDAYLSALPSFLIKLGMVVLGMIFFYVGRTQTAEE